MKRSKTLNAILERDNHQCGIHLEGCGQTITRKDSANIDHIIPKTLLKKKKGDSVFFKPNFLQPMHEKCNSVDKKGQLNGYPKFICQCHYLYFNVLDENVDVYYQYYIKHLDTIEWRKEVLLEGFIDDNKEGESFKMMVGKRGNTLGFKLGGDMGSILPMYKREQIHYCHLMNLHSLIRCKRVELLKNEYKLYKLASKLTGNSHISSLVKKLDLELSKPIQEFNIDAISKFVSFLLNPISYYYQLGMSKCKSGNLEEGISHLLKVIDLGKGSPKLLEVYSNLGYAYICAGNYEDAETNLLKALEINPHYDIAKGNLLYLSRLKKNS